MAEMSKNNLEVKILSLFGALPLLIWAAGSLPQRGVLKESLSVLTLVAFSLMVGLFYLSRINPATQRTKTGSLIKLHKIIGYTALPVLILHPLLLVVPRFYEAGVAPLDAFITIVTTFSSQGILFGLGGYGLLFLLGATALLRKKLPLSYPDWRLIHGLLALIALLSTLLHVVDLGRHFNLTTAGLVALLAAGGVYLLLKNWSQIQGRKR